MRHLGHREFDQLWKWPTKVMRRGQAYEWLARVMGLTEEETHFARFNARQCRIAIGAVRVLKAEIAAERSGGARGGEGDSQINTKGRAAT